MEPHSEVLRLLDAVGDEIHLGNWQAAKEYLAKADRLIFKHRLFTDEVSDRYAELAEYLAMVGFGLGHNKDDRV